MRQGPHQQHIITIHPLIQYVPFPGEYDTYDLLFSPHFLHISNYGIFLVGIDFISYDRSDLDSFKF